MNRTGLFIALGLALVIGLLFGIFPELDLKLAAMFYDPATTFVSAEAELARRHRPRRRDVDRMGARAAVARRHRGQAGAAGSAAVDSRRAPPSSCWSRSCCPPVVLTNLTFKSYWGRPRPVVVTQFNGPQEFVPWWDPRGTCGRNCSFFSGEGATAFWTYAPAALTPPAWRPLAYAAATVFGIVTSVLRMAFGGHFFTDVAAAGLVSFLVIWLAHGWIYRWPSTRLSDAAIDAALARLAWPWSRLTKRSRQPG